VQVLWTLASLGGDAEKTLHAALADRHPQVVAAALRTAEKLAANHPPKQESLFERLPPLLNHEHPTVRLQAVLTAGNVGHGRQVNLLAVALASRTDDALLRDAALSSLGGYEAAMLRQIEREPAWRALHPGRAEFIEALAAAVVRSGASAEIQGLLAWLDGVPDRFDWRQRAVLAGLALHAGRRGQATIALSAAPAVLTNIDAVTNRAVRARLEKLPRLFAWPGHEPENVARGGGRSLTAEEEQQFANGRQIFTTVCAGCHGPDGAGLEPQGPPLVDSEWVLGDAGRLVRIILHGIEGPVTVAGTRYEPPRILTEMPALAVLDNASIAAVLTYIRREWGHAAEPVTEKLVSQLRVSTQGRGRPWTEKELLEVKPFTPAAEGGAQKTKGLP
jgi:mono/diheme cytochrome c family protein